MSMSPYPIWSELTWLLRQARPQPLRTMREFAEQEIIIPDGPFAGRHFRCERQPYTGLWLDAVDSGRWSRCVATGPTQSGKTLSAFVIPMLYHLLEIGESLICGLPDMDMAADKWREDILPAIEQSRYRDQLPKRGGGSRGGRVESLKMGNGATLKFMSGGGSNKSRAGFTSRVVVITETDGMDQPGAMSREADKITQLEARTRAYGDRRRIYLECTVSTEQGRTWQEYLQGTRSGIVMPCPHCQSWVSPEREHLTGWQTADSVTAAQDHAAFVCPDCHQPWTIEHWIEANRQNRLVHHGQSIDREGRLQGDPPATDTLGFRWSAANNLFLTAAELAADEWKAAHSSDEENAERAMRQFVWCLPVAPTKWEETGAMTLFQTNPAEHLTLAKHLTAERKTEEFVTGKGVVVKWERVRRQNHFLDALYNACAAGHYAGARLVQEPKPEKPRVTLAELHRRATERQSRD